MGVAHRRAGQGRRRVAGRRGEHGAYVGVARPLPGERRQVGRPAEKARRRVWQPEVARESVELAGLGVPQVLRVVRFPFISTLI